VNFATRLKPEAVHVIAHSMGNRAVLRMVERVVGRAAAESPIRFGHLILAAPDVTPGLFRRVAERYRRIAERTTIYVSSRDKALALSNLVHGRRRVGDSASEVFVVDGIDTVVASEIDAGFLGHFAPSAREVLTDVHDLLHRGTPAADRFGMRVVEAGTSRYYVIQE
jgi:esterase/lipase superfamily enzyme